MLTAGLFLLLAVAQDAPAAPPALPPASPPMPRPAAPPVDNPLAPAALGLIECANPDEIARTCRSLAHYTPQPDGTFLNQAEVLLVPNEPVTITLAGQVRLKGNEACATLTTQMVKTGILRYAGTIVPDKAAAQITPRILTALTRAGVLDKEVCTTQSPEGQSPEGQSRDGNAYVEKGFIDGHALPAGDTHLVWVRPDAGYTVGPRNTPG